MREQTNENDYMPSMTKAEFRKYVDMAFVNGSEAVLASIASFVAELQQKVSDARDLSPKEDADV